MTNDLAEEQRREWLALYDQIRAVLQQFGEEDDYPGRKDFWLFNENLGLWQHKIEMGKLDMLRPVVIKSLQKLLIGYPNWEIAVSVTSPEAEHAMACHGPRDQRRRDHRRAAAAILSEGISVHRVRG